MNIKKNVLSFALIAGLSFGCMPQMHAYTTPTDSKINEGIFDGALRGFIEPIAAVMIFKSILNAAYVPATIALLGVDGILTLVSNLKKNYNVSYRAGFDVGLPIGVFASFIAIAAAYSPNKLHISINI